MSRSEVGVLSVGRCLREGIGAGLHCFVNTRSGLREVRFFIGKPGRVQAVLDNMKLPQTDKHVDVDLDTEVFLAKRNLETLTRAEIQPIAEWAARASDIPQPLTEVGVVLDNGVSYALAPDAVDEILTRPCGYFG